MTSSKYILSWYINPHLFWIRPIESSDQFTRFELEFENFYKRHNLASASFVPSIGEVVAYHDRLHNKWYRATIEHCLNGNSFIVWLNDYGWPVLAYKRTIRRLEPQFMAIPFEKVLKVGISNVIPAKLEYNFETRTSFKVKIDSWHETAVKGIKDLLEAADTIEFKKKCHAGDHNFGGIRIKTVSGNKIDVFKSLGESPFAKISQGTAEFRAEMRQLTTTDVLRCKKILDEHPQVMSPVRNLRNQEVFLGYRNDSDTESVPTRQNSQVLVQMPREVPQLVQRSQERPRTVRNVAENHQIPRERRDFMINLPQRDVSRTIPANRKFEYEIAERDDSENLEIRSVEENSGPSQSLLDTESKNNSQDLDETEEESSKNLRPCLPFETNHAKKSEIHFFGQNSDSDSNKNSFFKKIDQSQLPDTFSKLKERVQKREEERKNGKLLQKNDSLKAKFSFRPADYDQVIAQEQRSKKFAAERPYFTHTRRNFTKKDKNIAVQPRVQVKNLVLESLDRQMMERQQVFTALTTSDDTTTQCTDDLVPDNSENPIGEVEKKVEKNSHLLDCSVVLAHGYQQWKAVKTYLEVPFRPEIMKKVKASYIRTETRPIQAHSWPHILHEKSAFLISRAGSGKTKTLIPAICTNVINLFNDELIPETFGPVAIILTPSAESVSQIVRDLDFCLSYWREKTRKNSIEDRILVTESYGKASQDMTKGQLLGGTAILVTTPAALERWTNKWKMEGMPLFNRKRLKLFAVDDFDQMLQRHGETVCELIETFCDPKNYEENDEAPQLLVTSAQWENQLLKYFRYGRAPALFIANYIEACIYGRTQFRLNFVKNDSKMDFVTKFLEDDVYKAKRSVIICSKDEEIDSISTHLTSLGIKHVAFGAHSVESERNEGLTWYQSLQNEEYSVLICSDNVLGDLGSMRNVERLLHFSLADTWTTLSFRFTVFFDVFHDFVKQPKLPDAFDATFSHFLVDETSSHTLPKLVDFLSRMPNMKIPDEVQLIARNMLTLHEKEKASLNLCPFFLQYGIKLDQCVRRSCTGRHALSKQDAPTSRMPFEKLDLKMKITFVHNPIHFSGQILAYRHPTYPEWKLWQGENQLAAEADLNLNLQMYYAQEENQIKHFPVEKGDICVMEDLAYFHRCQVLQISKPTTSLAMPLHVVRRIDTGEIVKTRNLFVIPQHFREIPPRAIDIHFLGVVPYDGDTFWCRTSRAKIEKIIADFNKKSDKDFYVEANVEFRVENNIWTKKMTLCEPIVGDQYQRTYLYKSLLKENLAEKTEEFPQLEVLTFMARNLGFIEEEKDENDEKIEVLEPVEEIASPEIPKIEEKRTEEAKIEVRATWDYISQDSLHPIRIDFMDDLQFFSLIRADRIKKLDELNILIDNFQKSEKCEVISKPERGQNCLIPIDDGLTRGRIVDFGTDDQGDFVLVFSCDIGRTNKYDFDEIFTTTKEIVEFMSFCAIKGSFAGVEPLDGDSYDEETALKIWNLVDEAQKSGILYAKVVSLKENLEWLPGIYCYDLLLVAKNDKNERFLNHEIVETLKLAKWDLKSGGMIQKMKPQDLEEAKDDTDEVEEWENAVGTYKHEPEKPAENVPIDQEIQKTLETLGIDLKNKNLLEFYAMMGASPIEIAAIKHLTNAKSDSSTCSSIGNVEKRKISVPAIKENEAKKLEIPKIEEKPEDEPSNDDFLSYEYPPASLIWEETNDIVILSFPNVGENPDYHLEITKNRLIFVLWPESSEEFTEPKITIINFYGHVIPELVSHNVRGLNIIVRLPKRVSGYIWRQLQKEDEKFPHIRYNLDNYKPLEEEFVEVIHEEKDTESEIGDEFHDSNDEAFEETDYESDDLMNE
ncbi:putative ATP-dependent RNA helicase TDRD12 [Culicoides brevitarsis]|uniref:putative ATP-dependent RNA helicase TDRD12 n=1 Tax=Culicoides brevitarsis TaxID=469753 RepID=UPI00307C0629